LSYDSETPALGRGPMGHALRVTEVWAASFLVAVFGVISSLFLKFAALQG